MKPEPLRKQPRQSRSRALVNSILEAAGDLLGKSAEDPNAIPVQKIAERAGVGIGSVYDYFANSDGVWGGFLSWLTERNFTTLEQQVAGSGATFTERLPALVDASLALYLDAPARTRGVIMAIARLGWMKQVVKERDRFAHVLSAKLKAEHPHVPQATLDRLSEVLCDAVIGVVLGELWRDPDEARHAEVRQRLKSLVQREVQTVVGASPAAPG
ncbi:MAG: TetR/AcrR family transcriptional regulator [Archangiaceae bacterium]|nr:TetR/AcrR family transcriptional regulator [Archangiaceae bacterium]